MREEDNTQKKLLKPIELRNEEVQEIMEQVPAWILRRGITLLFLVVLALVIGSYFFKYPDVITTDMTLTGQSPIAHIVARSSGKIVSLHVKDGDTVKPDEVLAVIENPAAPLDVFYIKEILAKNYYRPDSLIQTHFRELTLGDMQSTYVTFLRSIHEYRNHYVLDYYPKKIAAVKEQIRKYDSYSENIIRQQQLMTEQHRIAGQQYTRDSLLYSRNILSPYEHESAQSTLLQSYYSLEGINATIENLKVQLMQLETSVLDLELQQAEKESQLQQDCFIATEQLKNAITTWELGYCLKSPIEGEVTFTKYWNVNQYIYSGENAFTVVPLEKEHLLGRSSLPVQRSGKVKVDQRVIIRFFNYPDQEFGIVNGKVSSISLVPTEGSYMVEVEFPNGLTTNYGITLPVSHEMTASAEIVTEDLRLIERFIQPLKKIWKEGFE